MSMTDITQLEKNVPVLREMRAGNEVFWMNPEKTDCDEAMRHIELTMEDVEDAERRLQRFAPFIRACFPETEETGGLIESALTPIPGCRACAAPSGRARSQDRGKIQTETSNPRFHPERQMKTGVYPYRNPHTVVCESALRARCIARHSSGRKSVFFHQFPVSGHDGQ